MTQFHTLVASDLDGTLLPEGQTELPCAVFDEIRRLHDCGVLFCAASGRPLDALRELFAPVADEIGYMSENAAYVCYGRELLHTIPMPRVLCAELVAYLGTRTDCVSRACTTTGRYYFVPTAAAQANLDAVGVEFGNCRIVKDFSEVKGDVTQISAISAGDMNIPAKEILPLWQDPHRCRHHGRALAGFYRGGQGQGAAFAVRAFRYPAGKYIRLR